jgi:hypothetical protein
MGPKVLFIFGIVVAHGAVAASLVRQEAPKQRESAATCVRAPQALPHFSPKRELLAMADIPISNNPVVVDLGQQ